MTNYPLQISLSTESMLKTIYAESAWRTACQAERGIRREMMLSPDQKPLLKVKLTEAYAEVLSKLQAYIHEDFPASATTSEIVSFKICFPRPFTAQTQISMSQAISQAACNHVLAQLYPDDARYCDRWHLALEHATNALALAESCTAH